MSDTDLVIQTEHLAQGPAAWLAGRCRLEVCPSGDPRLSGLLADARGLVVRTYTVVDEALLTAAPGLRVVGRAGVGVDNIDVPACRARDVEVVYTPDANTQAVVEYVLSLLGPVLRRSISLSEPVDADRWKGLRAEHSSPRQMSELTLGILGLGRIGGRLAEVARVIGFDRVLYNDLVEIPTTRQHGAVSVAVEKLFAEADIVSLHIDGRPSNREFVDRSVIGLMKPGVILMNTSRGFVVENLALAEFLQGNPGALALLDVHAPEPFGARYPLLGLANARLFPHLAASTRRADINMSWVVRDVVAVLEGDRPRHPAP
ncbi:MAG: NAD(P)-dependent oxidoreductase [Planctomycetota bacterium]